MLLVALIVVGGLVVVAGAIAVVTLVAREVAVQNDPHHKEARVLVRHASGSRSDDVVECTYGALDEYDSQSATERRQNFPRSQFRRIAVRYCQEVEREGLMDEPFGVSDDKALEVMQKVIRRMRANGELPPG